MHTNTGHEPIRLPEVPTATKWATNHNWNRRNAGRKAKEAK